MTGGCGSYDQKILTKISPLIGGMDILDFGRETKKYRIRVFGLFDGIENEDIPWAVPEQHWSMGHPKLFFPTLERAPWQVQRVV